MMSDSVAKSQSTSVELIFMPMAFYIFTQLDKIDSWQKTIGWIVVFVLIQNEYFSIKDASPKYNSLLRIPDYISIFVYWFAIQAITKSNPTIPAIGYDPVFWIYISVLWFAYAIWDWIMMYHEKSSYEKKDYRRWRSYMFICFLVTLPCGIALLSIQPTEPSNMVILSILQILPLGCVVLALSAWWIEALVAKLRKNN